MRVNTRNTAADHHLSFRSRECGFATFGKSARRRLTCFSGLGALHCFGFRQSPMVQTTVELRQVDTCPTTAYPCSKAELMLCSLGALECLQDRSDSQNAQYIGTNVVRGRSRGDVCTTCSEVAKLVRSSSTAVNKRTISCEFDNNTEYANAGQVQYIGSWPPRVPGKAAYEAVVPRTWY